MTIFVVLAIGVSALVQGSGDTSNVVHASTRVQLQAQSIMAKLTEELRGAAVDGGSTMPNGALRLVPDPDPLGLSWDIRYHKLNTDLPLYSAGGAIPWVETAPGSGFPQVFVLRLQGSEGAVDDGVDNDGDFLVDERQLVLLTDDTVAANPLSNPGTLTQVAVLGDNITNLKVHLETARLAAAPAGNLQRPRMKFRLTLHWLLRAVVKDITDIDNPANAPVVGQVRPWATYQADTWITFQN